MWVSPFRNLRIIGYLLLPEAYRSLSRLSSALSAKASALRSFSLGLSDIIALISDGLLVCCFSTSLLLQRLVSSLSLRLTYFQMFYICSFQGTFFFLTDMFYQPFKHKTSFMLKSLVKPVIITAFPRCIRLHLFFGAVLFSQALSSLCLFQGSGSHLLSHAVSSIVSSAASVLTVVFGMGTGVSPKRIATGNFSVIS